MTVLILYFCCGSLCFILSVHFCVARRFCMRLISPGGAGGTLKLFLYIGWALASTLYPPPLRKKKKSGLKKKKKKEKIGSNGLLYSIPMVRRPSVHYFHRSSSLKPLGKIKPNLKCSLLSGNGYIHNDHSIKTSSSRKSLGQSKTNFTWSILRKGGQSSYK